MAPEQPVQPVVPFAAGAVAARIAVELGCEELPAMAHNRSLHLRPGPYLIMPNDWPHCATWCARVIEAAGFSSAARTLRGMRARAEQALVKLARAEAQHWQEVGRFDLAHTWQSKIDAAQGPLSTGMVLAAGAVHVKTQVLSSSRFDIALWSSAAISAREAAQKSLERRLWTHAGVD